MLSPLPAVSIVIPAYNHAQFLQATVLLNLLATLRRVFE